MIKAELIGGSELIRKLSAITPNLQAGLLAEITRLSIILQSRIQSNKLSGQVLKTRTGTLRRSISHQVISTSNGVIGNVGTNSSYGLMHEFGFKGTENISAHLRTIKSAWGKSITPKQIEVRAHTRKVDYPERSFLRTALKELEPTIVAGIDNQIIKALNQ